MSLTNKGGLHGFITIVYVENVHARRELFWGDLHQVANQVHGSPWLVAGDFTLRDTQMRRWVVNYSDWAS